MSGQLSAGSVQMVQMFSQRRLSNIRVYDMSRIVRILAAVAVVFAVTAPVIATANVMSQAEKRLEQQRKDLVRNWGG